MLARLDPFDGLPRGHFGALLADPPWRFKSNSVARPGQNAMRHYGCMTVADIAALPVTDLCARNAHLFLCTTGPFLPAAFDVLRAWGFKYSSMAFVWLKLRRSYNQAQVKIIASDEAELHVGMGLTTRKNVEYVLLGRRGNPPRLRKDIREVILAPVREHSRKPPELAARVEQYCAGPYLELFARQRRPGWEAWGNEVGKFDEVAA